MPMPASLAALSRISNLRPGGNQFFDPSGDAFDRESADAAASDVLDVQTGINPTARHELALAELQDKLDAMDSAKALRRDAVRTADASFLGPEGWARSTPQDAAFDRTLEQKRRGVALAGELQPEEERQRDVSSEAAAGRAFMPEASALHGRDVQELLNKIREQYVKPQEERTNLAITEQELKNKGLLDVANTKAATAEDRAAKILGELLHRGQMDPKTGQSRPFSPEEASQLADQYGVRLPAPGGGGVWMMPPPDQPQTPKQVPPDQVEHFKTLGATVLR